MADAFKPATLAGKFVVFDGPDGCGKTTQLELLQERLLKAAVPVRRLREPGGTVIGELLRKILLAPEHETMDLRCEMFLYMASRAQLVAEQIKPALAQGEVVLSDRYASSTIAYQGGGGGLPVPSIMQVAEIAVDGVWPDLTVVFDLPIEIAMKRLNPLTTQGGLFQDRIEQRTRDYFERVRGAYLEQVTRWPERYRVVDAGRSIKEVEREVAGVVGAFFG